MVVIVEEKEEIVKPQIVEGNHVVTLGFPETDYESKELTSDFFPNKIGGNPSWLNLNKIPKKQDLNCKVCNNQLSFLIQFYSPWNEYEYTYHRMIYIFCCKNGTCKEYQVFRQQLDQDNQVYEIDQEERRYDNDFKVSKEKLLNRKSTCEHCGCLASSKCGKCQSVHYCSREHQSIDWELGHREQCGQKDKQKDLKRKHQFHFKEYLIVCEDQELSNNQSYPKNNDGQDDSDEENEDDYDQDKQDQNNNNNDNKEIIAVSDVTTGQVDTQTESMQDYQNYLNETGKDDEFSERTFTNIKDREFFKFKLNTFKFPDQILRYCKDENYNILWVSEKNKIEDCISSIPNCSNCGEIRKFEMQIMPQLLHFIDVDSDKLRSFTDIDFGVLTIYTCSKSCQFINESGIQQEYIFKQDFTK